VRRKGWSGGCGHQRGCDEVRLGEKRSGRKNPLFGANVLTWGGREKYCHLVCAGRKYFVAGGGWGANKNKGKDGIRPEGGGIIDGGFEIFFASCGNFAH